MKEFIYDEIIFKIGQNKYENNELLDESKQNDLWFHLNKLPSCHGILFSHNKNFDKTIIKQCCLEIKKYMKKNDAKVIYTNRKNIKKTDSIGKVIVKNSNFKIL